MTAITSTAKANASVEARKVGRVLDDPPPAIPGMLDDIPGMPAIPGERRFPGASRGCAGQVIGAGRQPAKLAVLTGLGADVTVPLGGDELGQAAADVDVDVVLDYLWGEPTVGAMTAVVTHRADRGQPLSWVAIGSMAGTSASIPSAALRAARLQLVGSGQGSVPARDIVAELSDLAAAITSGAFPVDAKAVPLSDVTAAWSDTASDQRLVLIP